MWELGGVLAWSVTLAIYDIAYRRLPDWLTLPAAGLAVVAAVFVDKQAVAGLLWPAAYLALAWRWGGIGGGDIKLAVPLGVWVAHHAGAIGTFVAMGLASALTLVLLLLRRSPDGPHGPAMLLGAWAVVLNAVY